MVATWLVVFICWTRVPFDLQYTLFLVCYSVLVLTTLLSDLSKKIETLVFLNDNAEYIWSLFGIGCLILVR